MKTHKNQQPAQYGLYLSFNPMDVRFVGAEGEALDGLADAEYRRVPTLLALALAPVLGACFVLAFPVLVIAAVLMAAAKLVVQQVRHTASQHAWIAMPHYEPVASYLTKGEKKADGAEAPAELSDLQKKVDEKRSQEQPSAENHQAQ